MKEEFIKCFIEQDRWKLFAKGLGVTFELTVFALLIGLVLGIIVAVVRTLNDQSRGNRNAFLVIVNAICKIYTTVIRGTPMLVQLLIWGFVIFKSSRNLVMVGAIGLGVNSGAYTAEIIRAGIMSIDPGQMEAGRSLGLGYFTVMKSVIIPQAIKNILPALGNEFITLFKDTSLVSAIGLADLTKTATSIGGKLYLYMPPLLGIAVVYLICVMIFTWLLGIFERGLRKSDRR